MKTLRFILLAAMAMGSLSARAQGLLFDEPEVSCNSKDVADAGYAFDVRLSEGKFLGTLTQLSGWSPSRKLGTEEVRIQSSTDDRGVCTLEITQKRDRDGNRLNLSITVDGDSKLGNNGQLYVEVDGSPIPKSFQKQTCSVSSEVKERLCENHSYNNRESRGQRMKLNDGNKRGQVK